MSNPRTGNLVVVRNRRGVVSSVNPFPGDDGEVLHSIEVDYSDHEGSSMSEQVLWEREVGARIVPADHLPDIGTTEPLREGQFDAFVRSLRWTALQPFLPYDAASEGHGVEPIAAPFHGAIQPEDYQLRPLLKALAMPRISLMISDDVGLGKTIESGMILSELILRRRIRRVLIITPASLRDQWADEMSDKFSLNFDVVDRDSTAKMRRKLGPDANPWRTFSRVVTSYHYLKQPDVWEDFRAASQTESGNARLSWDLLIVDEAHNLTPAPMGRESELSRMLGQLAPKFEHKIFLTATPHNGHTASFTGLLERLDPVRFTRTAEMSERMLGRVEEVNIRRLKSEINAQSDIPPFCTRYPRAIDVTLTPAETALSSAFEDLRNGIKEAIKDSNRQKRRIGAFAIEILGKRLLSSPYTLAESWLRFRMGLADRETASDADAKLAERTTREETGDDKESAAREVQAARTIGSWLIPFRGVLSDEIAALDQAFADTGLLDLEHSEDFPHREVEDSRFRQLIKWIDEKLREAKNWKPDERVIVFTEYKTTLDYLYNRLREHYKDENSLLLLYGNMPRSERNHASELFNSADSSVRILLATDAASEGLNLQKTARYLIHYDIPWNPARIEQRNGRIDRHGQPRDVYVHHFASDDSADLAFMARIMERVQTIREDLSSTGELFDRAFERRLIFADDAATVIDDLITATDRAIEKTHIPRDSAALPSGKELSSGRADLDFLAREIDFSASAMRDVLSVALSIGQANAALEKQADGRTRFTGHLPRTWSYVIDQLRIGATQALPALVFDPDDLIEEIEGGRKVFVPQYDTRLLHLAHPLMREALSSFARVRFQQGQHPCRWTVRRSDLGESGADAHILLTVEELAVNDLRETFHHWTRTLVFPVKNGQLAEPLAHVPAAELAVDDSVNEASLANEARDLWIDIEDDLRIALSDWRDDLSARFPPLLEEDRVAALTQQEERFKSRQGEVSKLIETNQIKKLEKEIASLQQHIDQKELFDDDSRISQLANSVTAKKEEIKRRREHFESLQGILSTDRERIINHLIPRRYKLSGSVQVIPVAIDIRFPLHPST